MGIEFRPLRASEVECRIGQVAKSGKGLSLLLYKDARCDMRLLDETVGAENWQCSYYECKGTLFCSLEVRVGDEWVRKDNAGAPSNMEAEKGEASDALKRAGFCWGIGRELYTAPFIWVPADKCEISNGKCFDRFTVTKLESEGGRITELVVVNERRGHVVFSWAASSSQMAQRGAERRPGATQARRTGDSRGDHLDPARALMRRYMDARGISSADATRELCEYMGVERMADVRPEDVDALVAVMRQTIDCVGA